MNAPLPWLVATSFGHAVLASFRARLGPHRGWPSETLLIDEPLALAEEKTSRLRRIYAKAAENLWDGNAVFRDAVSRHGKIGLSHEERVALAHPISMLTWGELAAWIVSAELAERLDDPDARMAASSQVFDEARHFYVLRDYLAFLHVPIPRIDPYFAIAVRTLLDTDDLTLKLFAMQILAEGTAQAIFDFLARSEVEPVLCEILPYIARDEARHVGLGILHLPERLARLSPRERRRLARRVQTIGDLLAGTQMRYIKQYRSLGLEPRELMRRADGLLFGLVEKLGPVPGTNEPYLRVDDPRQPNYEEKLDLVLPVPGSPKPRLTRVLERLVEFGARTLPV
jgi:hypothetical protein